MNSMTILSVFIDIQKPLGMVKNVDEPDMTLLLAFHLFSQLTSSPSFTMDNKKSNQPKMCPCRKQHGMINYGDTSIGKGICCYL